MKYIALDIGSSFIKSALLDTGSGTISGIEKLPTPPKIPSDCPLRHELDADNLFELVKGCVDRRLAAMERADGILLSTQMHGFILCDEAGKTLTPLITWQDKRCMETYPGSSYTSLELLPGLLPEADFRKTGVRIKPELALCNLYPLIRSVSLRNRQMSCSFRGRQLFCTLGSYIILRLTGKHRCHITNAAATGFVNLQEKNWSRPIMQAIGAEQYEFPEITGEDRICGHYASPWGAVPVYPDIGDHQASVLGAMGDLEKSTVVTIGTAGLISMITSHVELGDFEIRPFFGGEYLKTVTRLPGGRNIDVLWNFAADIVDTFCSEKINKGDMMEKLNALLSEKQEDPHLPQVELGFFGRQTGVQTGRIFDIDWNNLKADKLFASAFNQIALLYTNQIKSLSTSADTEKPLVLCGGIFNHNRFLMEKFRQYSGRPVLQCPSKEAELAGLYRLAVKISGKPEAQTDPIQKIETGDH